MIVPVAESITGTINECADMVELADTPSEGVVGKPVGVRVPPSAPSAIEGYN
jgi:hypothetical protein